MLASLGGPVQLRPSPAKMRKLASFDIFADIKYRQPGEGRIVNSKQKRKVFYFFKRYDN